MRSVVNPRTKHPLPKRVHGLLLYLLLCSPTKCIADLLPSHVLVLLFYTSNDSFRWLDDDKSWRDFYSRRLLNNPQRLWIFSCDSSLRDTFWIDSCDTCPKLSPRVHPPVTTLNSIRNVFVEETVFALAMAALVHVRVRRYKYLLSHERLRFKSWSLVVVGGRGISVLGWGSTDWNFGVVEIVRGAE